MWPVRTLWLGCHGGWISMGACFADCSWAFSRDEIAWQGGFQSKHLHSVQVKQTPAQPYVAGACHRVSSL